jgi:hypothetical protein
VQAFDRWRRLNAEERRLTMQSAVLVAVAAATLRVFGVDRALRTAARSVADPARELDALSEGRAKNVIDGVVTAVDRAGRYVPGGTCLSRSLALAWILRGRGIPALVRIGAAIGAPFSAHAWVECAGTPLNDAADVGERFATFSPLPPGP